MTRRLPINHGLQLRRGLGDEAGGDLGRAARQPAGSNSRRSSSASPAYPSMMIAAVRRSASSQPSAAARAAVDESPGVLCGEPASAALLRCAPQRQLSGRPHARQRRARHQASQSLVQPQRPGKWTESPVAGDRRQQPVFPRAAAGKQLVAQAPGQSAGQPWPVAAPLRIRVVRSPAALFDPRWRRPQARRPPGPRKFARRIRWAASVDRSCVSRSSNRANSPRGGTPCCTSASAASESTKNNSPVV